MNLLLQSSDLPPPAAITQNQYFALPQKGDRNHGLGNGCTGFAIPPLNCRNSPLPLIAQSLNFTPTEIANMEKAQNVEQYIANFSPEIQKQLRQIRSTIQLAAPAAVENISYGMPAYKLDGKPLVYFAGYKSHIGFYATPNGHSAFEKEFSKYKEGKGSVQFPLDEPMPLELIKEVVQFRIKNIREQ